MSQSWLKKRSTELVAEVQADLLPVMNIMFLLIPALLLAMEFASMAQITVSPPSMCANCGEKTVTKKETVNFEVEIRTDGFKATANGETIGEPIPLQNGAHDYAALAEKTRTLKLTYPGESRVTVSAESAVHMATLVTTLDTLRGDSCKLAGAMKGEQIPEDCLFWQPTISSRG